MGEGERHGIVAQDGVPVEGFGALRADHFVDVGRAADGLAVADRQVVALHEILGEDLPVGVPDVVFAECFRVAGEIQMGDHRLGFGEGFGRRRRVRIERHHDEAEPFLAAHGRQLHVGLAEALVAAHRRGAAQGAVEIVGPGVIGADDGAGIATPFQQRRHAVAADVGHRPQRAVAVTQHDDRLAGDLHRQVVAGVLQCVGPAGADPFLGEDVLEFEGEEIRRRVDRARHRLRRFEANGDVRLQFVGGRRDGRMDVHGVTCSIESFQTAGCPLPSDHAIIPGAYFPIRSSPAAPTTLRHRSDDSRLHRAG